MPGENVQADTQASRSEVVREPAFVRLAVDNVLLNFLGRDIEAALLAATNDISSLVEAGTGKLVEVESVARHVEVARVRMAPDTALTMFQNLCIVLVSSGLVSQDAIEQAFRNASETAMAKMAAEEGARAH